MLRDRLSQACDHVTPERNIALVAAIAGEFGCDIEALPSPHDLARYTCLVHALELTETPRYVAVASLGIPNVHAGAAFAHWLLDRGALKELHAPEIPEGSLAVYFDQDNRFTHVGITALNGRIHSKWGALGLYSHQLFDVPSNYGNTVKYFERLPYAESIELFCDYAEERGVEFQ